MNREYMLAITIAILFVICILLIIILIVLKKKRDFDKNRPLALYYEYNVELESGLMNEFDKACIKLAKHYSSDFGHMRRMLIPVFFIKTGERYMLSPAFAVFLRQENADMQADKFYEEILKYAKIKLDTTPDLKNVLTCNQFLVDEVIDAVMSTDEAKKLQSDILNGPVADAEAENKKLSSQCMLAAYNLFIKDIKLAGGRGLMPEHEDVLHPKFVEILGNCKIYTHQKLYMSGYDSKLDGKGCYIIYNTYNKKHYVGISDHVGKSLGMYFSDEKAECIDLQSDINSGHFVVAKAVMLNGSGYKNVKRLYLDLCKAYGGKDAY